METPQLDLASELLGVYSGDGGSSESGEDEVGEKYQSTPQRNHNASNTPYTGGSRKVKASLGQHKKTVTKRTRFPLKWNRVRTFTDENEAQTFIQSFEGYNWRKGCNNKTSGGLKCYYICKESSFCKVMSLLHYDSKNNEVVMYQSDRPHYHGSTPRNGVPPSAALSNSVSNGVSNQAIAGSSSTNPISQGDIKLFQADGLSGNENDRESNGNGRRTQDLQLAVLGPKKVGGGRRRGLSDETIAIINRLFSMDPHIKPSQVQEELKRAGIPLLQNYHINNFLAKLRKQLKQAGEAVAGSVDLRNQQRGTRTSVRSRQHPERFSENFDDRSGGMVNGHTDYYSDDADNSSTTDTWFNNPNPMSMVDINLTNPFDDDSDGEDGDDAEDGFMDENDMFDPTAHTMADEHGDTLLGLHDAMSVTISGPAGNPLHRQNSNSFSPPLSIAARRFSTASGPSGGPMPTSTTSGTGVRNNQSEVVSTSNSSRPRKRNFYFRDESTRDGDNISPHEDSIKGLIVQHIQDNYSNRDMLHIREELRTLKDMKKFRALNRLLSFTAGFLQDSFLDTTSVTSNGHGTTSPTRTT